MRFFPVHIIIKDLSFWLVFFLMVKFINHHDYFFRTEWWTGKEIIGTSVYMAVGFAIVDFLIHSVIYAILKTRKRKIRTFWFGVLLHLITLLLIYFNINIEGRTICFWIASLISSLIAGIIYQKLNSKIGIENQIRKGFGA